MKALKNIALFILMTLASSIAIFALFIVLFRIDLVLELLSSKPVLLLFGLTIGTTAGFLVGVLATYYKLNTELEETKTQLEETKTQFEETKTQLEEAIDIIKSLASKIGKLKQRKANNTAKQNNDKRKNQLFSEISDLSENDTKPVVEEEVLTDDEKFDDNQDEVADET